MTTAVDYTAISDAGLMEHVRESDRSAFGEIYNRYHIPVYQYVKKLVEIRQLAEDIVHEVFLNIWEKREQLDIRENVKSYLFRSCHNRAVDATLRIAKERSLKEEFLKQYTEEFQGEERKLEELYKIDGLVEEALASLAPGRRRVYEMCKKEGKSYQQVADELNISISTVRDHMTNALAALRRFLHERDHLVAIILFSEIFF